MAAAHFHFALSEWSISCCCPDLVPSLGIDYGKQVNLFSSQSEDQRGHMKTWCRHCHTLPRDSGLWVPCHDWFGLSVFLGVGVGVGKKVSEFQPPTRLLSSPPTFPACLVSVPTVGTKKTLQSTAGALSEWGRWLFPFCIPQGRTDATQSHLHQVFSFYPPTDFWHFSILKYSVLHLPYSLIIVSFSLGFITLGNKRWVIRIPGSGISP